MGTPIGFLGTTYGQGLALAAMPSTMYLGVSTTLPTAAGTNVSEPTNTEYARQGFTRTTNVLGIEANAADIVFPTALTAWADASAGQVFYWYVFYDQVTGGNLVGFSPLIRKIDSVAIPTNPTWTTGSHTVTVTGADVTGTLSVDDDIILTAQAGVGYDRICAIAYTGGNTVITIGRPWPGTTATGASTRIRAGSQSVAANSALKIAAGDLTLQFRG